VSDNIGDIKMGFSEDDRIRAKNRKKKEEPLRGADIKAIELKPMFGTTLMLVPPDGFHRCIRCHVAKPTGTGFYKKDLLDKASGFCIDCIDIHGREVLTSSLKMRD
jgi:hypothetical protein